MPHRHDSGGAAGLLKLVGALVTTAAVAGAATIAVREYEKEKTERKKRDDHQRWPIHHRSKSLESEKTIELDDNGIIDFQRLRDDIQYQRSCAIRGFDTIDVRNSGEYRGRCFVAVLDRENFLTTVCTPTSRDNPQSTLYYSLLAEPASEKAEESISVIKRDVTRTKIHVTHFNTEEEANDALYNVLSAYAKHDAETGYCQGMNMIVGYLLTKMNEEKAYWFLYTLMTNKYYNLRTVYATDMNGLLLFKYQFDRIFLRYLPRLYQHFQQQNIHADVLVEYWLTLFTVVQIPRSTVDRIWDLYIVDGFKAIHRVTLSILAQSEETLLGLNMEEIYVYLKQLPDHGVLEPDLLINSALSFSDITEILLDNLALQYKNVAKRAGIDQAQQSSSSSSTSSATSNNNNK